MSHKVGREKIVAMTAKMKKFAKLILDTHQHLPLRVEIIIERPV
jgi:hypothetical protein